MKRSRKSAKSATPAKIDIRSVAERAGVSIATVSRAMNRVPTVDAELAERVWAAVKELNYLPNTQARALVSGKSRLLGLIVSEITNPFFPELIQEFENVAVRHGYEILIASTNYERKKMEECARRMLERKVDGVAVMTFGIEDFLFERFAADKVPVVFVDAAPERPMSSALAVDYRVGIDEGVRHLVGLGHTKIGFITGPLRLRSAQARKAAFVECMQSAGVNVESVWVVEGEHTLESGRDAMERLLAMKERPTAVMCSNDMTAIGVQHALFEAGLKVPEDLSLIGFDDIHLAEYTIPPLTTVRMACKDLAERSVGALLVHLKSGVAEAAAEMIPTRLIVRQTTGAPKEGKKARR
ncbi:LacI family DNA-binding transcriptional regulator [Granulicella sp. 5B5]|uniref:LacI family DNA-binding transcriptional regulator n=1 Tax=Granulicella sp. 5B5 TaxID=1617967 RepID=UPI0015F4AD75|nr:LacI family DNA-binding transcriptional regulator [Granulicella sp. 5B5]QMV17944.1 LacI family DNA-binding transcriptional regulator [Granulicella sp. 5B5]